jgi:hypothetical protein
MERGRVPSLRVPVRREGSLLERAMVRGVQRKRENGAASVDKGIRFDGEVESSRQTSISETLNTSEQRRQSGS